MLAITLFSCQNKKDKFLPEPNNERDDILSFEDRDAFENAIKSHKYKSKRISDTNSPDHDDFFSLLSPQGLIQIGDKIFRVDTLNKRVLVLDASHENELQSLINGDTTNPDIMIFSTHDEVLTLLEDGYTKSPTIASNARLRLFCKARFAEREKDEQMVYYGNDSYRLDNKLVYQTVGIYFSLQAKSKSEIKGIIGWNDHPISMRIQYEASWTPRCQSSGNAVQNYIGATAGNNIFTNRVYESSRALSNYSYRIRYTNQFANFTTRDYFIAD